MHFGVLRCGCARSSDRRLAPPALAAARWSAAGAARPAVRVGALRRARRLMRRHAFALKLLALRPPVVWRSHALSLSRRERIPSWKGEEQEVYCLDNTLPEFGSFTPSFHGARQVRLRDRGAPLGALGPVRIHIESFSCWSTPSTAVCAIAKLLPSCQPKSPRCPCFYLFAPATNLRALYNQNGLQHI